MHRRGELIRLLKEFRDLELPEVCAPLDQFTSVRIRLRGTTFSFVKKYRGKEEDVAIVYTNTDGEYTGMVVEGNAATAMTLVLFSLEIAVENN